MAGVKLRPRFVRAMGQAEFGLYAANNRRISGNSPTGTVTTA